MKTIRQEIIPDEAVKRIFNLLYELPERCLDAKNTQAEAEAEMRNIAMELEEAKNRVATMDEEALFEVTYEMNDDNKKKYANDGLRKTAAKKLNFADSEYQLAVDALLEARRKKIAAEMRAGKIHNSVTHVFTEFKSACAAATLISGLCHEDHTNQVLERLVINQEAVNNDRITLSRIKEHITEELHNGNGKE